MEYGRYQCFYICLAGLYNGLHAVCHNHFSLYHFKDDVAVLTSTFDALPEPSGDRPVCVIARTRKGAGASLMEQAPQAWHLGLLNPEQKAALVAEISGRLS